MTEPERLEHDDLTLHQGSVIGAPPGVGGSYFV
jgi:hypothetical protein